MMKFQLPAVNYYHKVLHLAGCNNPGSASGIRAKILNYILFEAVYETFVTHFMLLISFDAP